MICDCTNGCSCRHSRHVPLRAVLEATGACMPKADVSLGSQANDIEAYDELFHLLFGNRHHTPGMS